MGQGFRERFLVARSKEWFCEGLVIESASAKTTAMVLPRLGKIFPYVNWDILTRHERSGFRSLYRIKRPLGGLRLLFSARRHYEIVVFFHAAGDQDLRLYPWLALLLMRPRRFFVFIENGDGFWLAVEDASKIRKYFKVLQRPLGPEAFGAVREFDSGGIQKRVEGLAEGLRWIGLLSYAAATLLLAVALLAFFRLFYDTRYYRFRLFSKKKTLHPQRESSREPSRPPAV